MSRVDPIFPPPRSSCGHRSCRLTQQTNSNIVLKEPVQKTHSVRGFISTNGKSGLAANDVYAIFSIWTERHSIGRRLTLRLCGAFRRLSTSFLTTSRGGRYVVFALVMGEGWWTKKTDADVVGHSGFISLEVVHKK
jgi:hypothetical protein